MSAVKFLMKNFNNTISKDLSSTFGMILSKPLQISIQPNERCNARCIMCDCWHEKDDYINADEIINVLDQLYKWVGKDFFVQIAGGEPLIYDGIFDIFKYCSERGIIIKISTNGIALNEKTCDKIIASGLPYLSVSLDSHLPEIHDKYRGVPRTFERATNGIKYLSANSDMTLGITSILFRDNISTFADSVDYFLSLPIHRLLIQPIRIWTENLPVEKWPEYEFWVNDQEALAKTTAAILEMKKHDKRILNTEKDIQEWITYFTNPGVLSNNKKKKCRIGYDRLSVNYKGKVFLGCHIHGSIGSIKESNLKEMWKSAKAQKIRKAMKNCHYPCTSNCFKELSLGEKIQKALLFMRSGLFSR